jgi:hypothetical protein
MAISLGILHLNGREHHQLLASKVIVDLTRDLMASRKLERDVGATIPNKVVRVCSLILPDREGVLGFQDTSLP